MIEIIKFGAEWCGPCKMMGPAMKNLKEKYNVEGSDIQITDIDVDMNPESAELHKIKTIPTIILQIDGKEIKKIIGVKTYDDIEKIINEVKIKI